MISYALSAALTIGTAWGLHLTKNQQGIVITAGVALATIVTALLAAPPQPTVAKGAVLSAFAAFAAFGFHISPNLQALVVSGATILFGLILRTHLTPTIKLASPVAAAPVAGTIP